MVSSRDPIGLSLYMAYGLDLTPDAARVLTIERALSQVAGLRLLSNHDAWVEAAKDDDYGLLFYFEKDGGLVEAVINPATTTNFLGVGQPDPERVWLGLGYRVQEDLGDKVTWTNGDAKIVAYGSGDRLVEVHYIVPERAGQIEEEATSWRELGFFNGGRGCIESAVTISGRCFVDVGPVLEIIRFVVTEWPCILPPGFWMARAEAFDKRAGFPYSIAYDDKHEAHWLPISVAMNKARRSPRCSSKPIHLTPSEFMTQALIETVHIKGLLQRT